MKKTLLLIPFIISGCFSTITQKDRITARMHYDLGVASMRQGDITSAIREFNISVNDNPTFPQVHNALGLVYHQRGLLEKADHHYQKAIILKDDFSEAFNNYGALLMDMGRYEKAAVMFKKVLEDIMYPTPDFAEGNLGWAYFKLKKPKQAITHLKNSIATNPKFCRGYLWLADVYSSQNQYTYQAAQLEKFLAICSKKAEIAQYVAPGFINRAHYDLGSCYQKLTLVDRAYEQFKECTENTKEIDTLGQLCRQALQAVQRGQ